MNPDQVEQAVWAKFNELQTKKSNEFTVLSGFVAMIDGDYSCISLATGLKCLSNKKRTEDKGGNLVADCHAEILSNRALKFFFLSEITKESTWLLEKVDDKWKLKNNVQIGLYISQSPCGDATVEALETHQSVKQQSTNFAKRMKFEKEHGVGVYRDAEAYFSNGRVLRGRENYTATGKLRTKPGRIDAESTLSMSCSDKIAKWICLGLGGALVNFHLMEPIILSQIVIGDDFNLSSLERALLTRTANWRNEMNRTKTVEILNSRKHLKATQGDAIRSDKSLVWTHGRLKCDVLTSGYRQGHKHPKTLNWPLTANSFVSKRNLASLFVSSLPSDCGLSKYRDLKLLSKRYQTEKALLYSGPFLGWITLAFDDFDFDENII